MKELTRKFSYQDLKQTCEREGWRLPTKMEADNFNLDKSNKEAFWISNPPSREEDVLTHACVYDPQKKDTEMIANKSFIMKAIVIKIPCTFTDKGVVETSCGHSINYPEIKSFKYCPFCGKETLQK